MGSSSKQRMASRGSESRSSQGRPSLSTRPVASATASRMFEPSGSTSQTSGRERKPSASAPAVPSSCSMPFMTKRLTWHCDSFGRLRSRMDRPSVDRVAMASKKTPVLSLKEYVVAPTLSARYALNDWTFTHWMAPSRSRQAVRPVRRVNPAPFRAGQSCPRSSRSTAFESTFTSRVCAWTSCPLRWSQYRVGAVTFGRVTFGVPGVPTGPAARPKAAR